jgi:L-iditol 2-dehydrogenase
MAKMLGAGKIIAIGKSEYRLKLAKQLAVNETVSLDEFPNQEDRIRKIANLTEGLGADLVIECTGDPNIISEGLDMLRLGGTYLVEGAFVEEGGTMISASRQIVAKNARIIGAAGMPYQAYARVLKMMASFKGFIPFSKAVTHQFGVDAAEAALLKSMASDSMKVVVNSRL